MEDTPKLTGPQRRAAWKAHRAAQASALDRVTEGDANFFAANPGRSHYTRPAAPVEVRDIIAGEGVPMVLPAETALFAIIHQVRPGVRFRQFCALPADTDGDVGEARARALWDEGAPVGSEIHRIVTAAAEHLHPNAGRDAAPASPTSPGMEAGR